MIYDNKTIEMLLKCHKKHPKDIIAHRITRLYYNEYGDLNIFKRQYYNDVASKVPSYLSALKKPSFFNKQTGCGGCLYPPGCFHSDVLDEEQFMNLAPTSDDIWFWLQAVRNKRRVRVPKIHFPELHYIPGTQEVGLYHINDSGEKLFFVHLRNILESYPEIESILKNDHKKI